MPPKLRYEFYLPTFYNNEANPEEFGKPIEKTKFRKARSKIIERFGCLSMHGGTIQGVWTDKETKKKYYDVCYKWEITVNIKGEDISFFEQFKEYLLSEFKQYQIYMICTEVNKVE